MKTIHSPTPSVHPHLFTLTNPLKRAAASRPCRLRTAVCLLLLPLGLLAQSLEETLSANDGPASAEVLVDAEPRPHLAPLADLTIHAGTVLDFPILTSAPGEHPLVFNVQSDPPSTIEIHPVTGRLQWDTAGLPLGPTSITVTLLDPEIPGLAEYATFRVELVDPLRIQRVTRIGDKVELTWNALPGQRYLIQSRPGIDSGGWVFRDVVTATGYGAAWLDMIGTSPEMDTYRIRQAPVIGVPDCNCCACDNIYVDFVQPLRNTVITPTWNPDNNTLSVSIEMPLLVLGDITCSVGAGVCEGTITPSLRTEGLMTWWSGAAINDKTEVRGTGNGSGSLTTSVDPAQLPVIGDCESTIRFSKAFTLSGTAEHQYPDDQAKTIKQIPADKLSWRIDGRFLLKLTIDCGVGGAKTRHFNLYFHNQHGHTGNVDTVRSDFNGDGQPDILEDYDGDGVSHQDENGKKTSPFKKDTDGDRNPDGTDPEPTNPKVK